jgi:hypothetical protein
MTPGPLAQRSGEKPLTADPIDLIAVDLDGTLLRPDGSIGAQSAAAIAEAVAAGIKVVVNTGRAPRDARFAYHRVGLKTLLITHNGALVTDPAHDDAIFRHVPLPGAVAATALRMARQEEPMLPADIEVIDRCVGDPAGPPSPGADLNPNQAQAVAEFRALLAQPITKLRLYGTPAQLGGVQLTLMGQLRDQIGFAISHAELLQVVGPGVNKGTGLAYAARHYQVPRQRVMAIGDAPNDIPMLQWAGLSVAVANAWDDVRRQANFIVADNEHDGVAEAIRRFALMR